MSNVHHDYWLAVDVKADDSYGPDDLAGSAHAIKHYIVLRFVIFMF